MTAKGGWGGGIQHPPSWFQLSDRRAPPVDAAGHPYGGARHSAFQNGPSADSPARTRRTASRTPVPKRPQLSQALLPAVHVIGAVLVASLGPDVERQKWRTAATGCEPGSAGSSATGRQPTAAAPVAVVLQDAGRRAWLSCGRLGTGVRDAVRRVRAGESADGPF